MLDFKSGGERHVGIDHIFRVQNSSSSSSSIRLPFLWSFSWFNFNLDSRWCFCCQFQMQSSISQPSCRLFWLVLEHACKIRDRKLISSSASHFWEKTIICIALPGRLWLSCPCTSFLACAKPLLCNWHEVYLYSKQPCEKTVGTIIDSRAASCPENMQLQQAMLLSISIIITVEL